MNNPLVSPEPAARENQVNVDAAAFEELIAQETVGGADAADIQMGLLVKGGRHANVTNYTAAEHVLLMKILKSVEGSYSAPVGSELVIKVAAEIKKSDASIQQTSCYPSWPYYYYEGRVPFFRKSSIYADSQNSSTCLCR